jgi:hypothetical protein
MIKIILPFALAALPVVLAKSSSSSCSAPVLTASYPTPSVASGYEARIVASGLQSPRGIKFDTKGRLLVVEQDLGIQAITFNDGGGNCLSVQSKESVVDDGDVNYPFDFVGFELVLTTSCSYIMASSCPRMARHSMLRHQMWRIAMLTILLIIQPRTGGHW